MIIGLSGAGKSTLARTLADDHGVVLLHLDSVHFLPGWVERPREEEKAIVGEFLDEYCKDGWVIEGHYPALHFERRAQESDQIFIVVAPRLVRLLRVFRRWLRYRGTTRPDLGEGNPETLNLEFVRWVLWDGCTPARMGELRAVRDAYLGKTTVVGWRWWPRRFALDGLRHGRRGFHQGQ